MRQTAKPIHNCPECKCPTRLVLKDGQVVVPEKASTCIYCGNSLTKGAIKGARILLRVGKTTVGQLWFEGGSFCLGTDDVASVCLEAVAKAAMERCNAKFDFNEEPFATIRRNAKGAVNGYQLRFATVRPADPNPKEPWIAVDIDGRSLDKPYIQPDHAPAE